MSANHAKNPRSIKLKKSRTAERRDRMILWYVFIDISPQFILFTAYTNTAQHLFRITVYTWNYTRIRICNE